MPYNIKQLGEKSVSISFFIVDRNYPMVNCPDVDDILQLLSGVELADIGISVLPIKTLMLASLTRLSSLSMVSSTTVGCQLIQEVSS